MALLLVAVGVATLAGPATAESVDVEHTVGMTEEAGTVDVTTQVFVPSGTASLRVTIPRETDVYEKRGFTRVDHRTYEWTRSTDEPSLSYTMAGNVTVDRGNGDRHLFAVTDAWAIVSSPTVDIRTASSDVAADERYRVEGQGAAGPDVTYLGAHARHVRAADQRFTLVVPDAADMATTPAAALDSLEQASRRIEFGRRDDEVFVVVAPTTVEWAATGLQRGDADMWIRDVQRVDTVRNAWIHEYVHTRQDYEPTAETRWTVEAMAEYYAALVPFEAGRIAYGEFRSKLEDGRSAAYDDVVLAEPATWEPDEGDYVKGALVWAALDRRLHAEADASMGDVVATFGDREVSQADFLDTIERIGGAEVRSEAREYTETTATPEVRSETEHVRAFGGPLVRNEFDGFAVSGPARETDVAAPRLVTGETLEATVVVRNEGTDTGGYSVPFRVDGRTVATRGGTLDPGESATLSFTHTFRTAGEYDLRAGTATATAVVRRPAEPTVTDLSVDPVSPARGEPVRISATVGSSADRPANGTITIAVDGDALATRRVAVADVTTVEATTSFDAAGEHTVGAGDQTKSVTIREVTVTPTASPPPSNGTVPGTPSGGAGAGPGIPLAVAALAGAALLLGGRSS
ncbi:hypothetical protein BRC85_11295 [Halobacteriales archaeon QS_1_69_70]|nr:MAG: hypothetical protein BRC85_11295 [Halobacteriales archaeon QS_1_69_70]